MVRPYFLAAGLALALQTSGSVASAQSSPTAAARPAQAAPVTVDIYPNPASVRALVDLESVPGTAEKVVVCDLRGETWIEVIITSNQKTVELATSDLANGVYVVTVTTSTTKGEAKLIVQH